MNDVSFSVEAGSVFAFLGENGAGKSTTIGCITTTVRPTSGTIIVDGFNVATHAYRVRSAIGAVFQLSLLDPLLTVRENLYLRAGFYGLGRQQTIERVKALSDLVKLDSFLDRRYGPLSGGQKRRADIARALIHDPSILFLDEPTSGLDPQSREHIWAAIQQLRDEHNTTVFLTTHYMEETERADQVCIIDQGSIVTEGTPAALRAKHSSSLLTVRGVDRESIMEHSRQMGFLPHLSGDDIVIPVDSSTDARHLLATLDIEDFEFRHGTMDDVFLAVTRGAQE